jgi:preflagellin peptidase FlaK
VLLAFFLSFFGLVVAAYTDLKQRIVPNKLNLFLLASGLVLYAVSSVLYTSWQPIIFSLIALTYSFLLAYVLYKVGFWAGGDVKLFAALGCLNPVNPFIARIFGFQGFVLNEPLFPIELFAFTLFAILPVTIAILIKRSDSKLRAKLLSFLAIIVLFALLSVVVNVEIVANAFAYLAVLLLAYFLILCFPLAKSVFVREVKISELQEGDIPAEAIRVVNGKVVREKGFNMKKLINYMVQYKMGAEIAHKDIVSPLRARGVTPQEITELNELVAKGLLEDSILIKESAPMVPAILVAYIVLNFTGDLLWLMMV